MTRHRAVCASHGRVAAGVYPGLLRAGAQSAASRADELAAAGAEFCERKVRAIRAGGDGRLLYKARTTASMLELVAAGFLAVRFLCSAPARSWLTARARRTPREVWCTTAWPSGTWRAWTRTATMRCASQP